MSTQEAKQNRDRLRRVRNQILVKGFKSVPCVDCGITYPYYCMDFDHIKGVKKTNIQQMVDGPTGTLLKEIEKCEIVCANCHRLRTHKTPTL